MPVGTQATVKALTPPQLVDVGASLVLGNAYHLYLRPGVDVVRAHGGLRQFMGWDGPLLTDSGGFQVFSLARLRRIDSDGVTFRDHIDGSEHRFTPESVVWIQEQLGADIAMVLDECTPFPSDYTHNAVALERTHSWAERSLTAHQQSDQALFAIVQGGMHSDLRQQSVEFLTLLPFDGYAVGGLSVGEPKAETYRVASEVLPRLPVGKPRYLMGVGSPEDLLECIALGADMFDCVLPTRVARNGSLFTPLGRLNIRNARFREALEPIDPTCDCYTCRHFSAAYLHHLYRCEELLAYTLGTLHNLRFLFRLMSEAREAILVGGFLELKTRFLSRYLPADQEARHEQRERRVREKSPGV